MDTGLPLQKGYHNVADFSKYNDIELIELYKTAVIGYYATGEKPQFNKDIAQAIVADLMEVLLSRYFRMVFLDKLWEQAIQGSDVIVIETEEVS